MGEERFFRSVLSPLVWCRGQVVTPGSQDSTAVVEGTSTSDVLLLLKTGLRYVPKWKTEG